jgi:hypothetical protein
MGLHVVGELDQRRYATFITTDAGRHRWCYRQLTV